MGMGYQPIKLRSFSHISSYFIGSQSKSICCISNEATILKCLEDKNERFEKIYVNILKANLMEEFVINNVPHLLTVNKNELSLNSLETS